MRVILTNGIVWESVLPIWCIWLASMVVLTAVIQRSTRNLRWRDFQKLLRDECGSAYTLSYVLCFPLYMLLICLIIEASLVLIVKIGTIYAAYASGRTAIVWLNAAPDLANKKIRQAACNAMTPFSSSNSTHLARLGGVSGLNWTTGFQLNAAYRLYAQKARATSSYLRAKADLAAAATKVSWNPEKPVENQDVTLTLTYRMPLHIPGAARVLGYPDGVYPIQTTVVLQNEGAKRVPGQDPRFPMGIHYRSDR